MLFCECGCINIAAPKIIKSVGLSDNKPLKNYRLKKISKKFVR